MIYIIAVAGLLIVGYTINDVADFSQDRPAERDIAKAGPSRKQSLITSIGALAISVLLLFSVTREALPLAILAGTVLIGVEYSLPPLRFKERGLWGVLIGAATQRPALFLIFAAMLSDWTWLAAILSIWLFCGGILAMLGHQIEDYHHDRAVGAPTFVALHGIRISIRLCVLCGVIIGAAVLSPFVFIPGSRAFFCVGILTSLSSVYALKGFRALRNIRLREP